MAIPGYAFSKISEMLPSTNPSRRAYIGAVTGDQDFLKTVTRATTSPPIAPRIASPAACSGECVVAFQDHAALAMAKINKSPVLFTVPVSVMVSPRATPSPRKVLSFNVGLEVLIRLAIRTLLGFIVTSTVPPPRDPDWITCDFLAR